ncbi:MAG: hypothetical protein BKP49_06595 [Treponema sp. CETP13]|nr:MAG: hypothetical protein BKP49_06595 [Treponema sp. CETP13]
MMIASFLFLPIQLSAKDIVFKADSMSGKSNDANSITTLIGNAYIKTDDMEISADKIEISGKNYRIVTVTGNISGTSIESGFTFECSEMQYDRETKVAILEKNVKMNDTENDVKIEAEYIYYDQASQTATMQVSVKILQENATCTSSFAIYRKEAQILELSGSPKIVKGEDTYTAREITMNIDTEEMVLVGKVTGTVSEEESSKKTNNSSEPRIPTKEGSGE